jgi:two-component system chemotaxis response regulator CheY
VPGARGPPFKDGPGSVEQGVVKKILVVDHSAMDRSQVRQALERVGYDVIEAFDGVDGLEKIRSSLDLSLVLCDVNMPRMTGLDLIAQIKAEGLSPPVLVLTSEGQPSLVRRARDAGAKGWIV